MAAGRRRSLVLIAVGLVLGFSLFVWLGRGGVDPSVPTGEVTRGDYVDVVEIRGEIRPVRSTYVTAPYNAGELQIVEIARNGTTVETGDVVVRFDAVNLRRTIQEKQSELRSAVATLEQGEAQRSITLKEREAAVSRAEFDVQRARLSMGEIGLVSAIDGERARLALVDAEQRLREAQAAAESAEANARTEREAGERNVEKIRSELALAERQIAALSVTAPTDGIVNILPNYRTSTPLGTPQEYRNGDQAFPGALILELPDLSSVYLTARLDEADRGPLTMGQDASIRVDAIPDRDYDASVNLISLLARTDFTSGWPPPKQFDLILEIHDADDRLRPGMSAAARITVGRLPDVLLVPAEAIFYESGRTVVYRAGRRAFDPVEVEVVRRGREQAAVSGALDAGDRVALVQPALAGTEGQP